MKNQDNFLTGLKNRLSSNKLVRDYIWVFIGQNMGSVFSMVSMLITLRLITTEAYGALVTIQTYCMLISSIISVRTFNSIIKFSGEAETAGDFLLVKKYINTGWLVDSLTGITGVLCAWAFLHPITRLMGWEPEMLKYVYYYLPVVLFLPFMSGTPVGMLRKLGHYKQINIVHALVFGLQTLLLGVMYLAEIRDFRVILASYAAIECLEALILILLTVHMLWKDEQYHDFYRAGLTYRKEFLTYNLSNGMISTFDQMLGHVSTLLINKYIGNLATAYLKIITKICSILSKFTNPVGQILYPEFCRLKAGKQYKKSLKLATKYFLLVSSFGSVLGLLIFSTYDWWIGIFDAGMQGMKFQSFLYFVYTILSIASACIHQLSLALDMMKFNLVLVGIMDVLYIIVLIPMIQVLGVEGYLLLQILQLVLVLAAKMIYMRRVTVRLEAR